MYRKQHIPCPMIKYISLITNSCSSAIDLFQMKCSRCDAAAETKTRGENFCAECYYIFISKKFRVEMSLFRVNGQLITDQCLPNLTVFVSLGVSSLALVELLLDMQEAQRHKNNGMTGFNVSCIHIKSVNTPSVIDWPWPDLPLKQVKEPTLDLPSKSRSSRHDMEAVLCRDSAKSLAEEYHSFAVLGYSLTKLSELTSSETVKGRGAAIPRLISPDIIEDRTVYPLKGITSPESQEYGRLRGFAKYIVPDPVVPGITKMQSIDEITRQYFSDVQKDFPSVVSTVAKVASRLRQLAEPCGLCQQDNTTNLCYACRSSLDISHLSKKFDISKEYEL